MNQLALSPPTHTHINTRTFTRPTEHEMVMNPRKEIPVVQRQKVLAMTSWLNWPLRCILILCSQVAAFRFEEFWLRVLDPLKGVRGEQQGTTAARLVSCSFSRCLLDSYCVPSSATSLGYSGAWDTAECDK